MKRHLLKTTMLFAFIAIVLMSCKETTDSGNTGESNVEVRGTDKISTKIGN